LSSDISVLLFFIVSVAVIPRYVKGMEDTPEVVSGEVEETGDPSHEMDLEPVFQAVGAEAEMEAIAVHSVLQSNGIEAVLIGSSSLPNFPFEVRVPHEQVDEANALIEEARASGPAAAEEAEKATE
jgi:hypothetical protein